MSLHTIVVDELAGRLRLRRARTDAIDHPRSTDLAARLSGASMRVLETTLAVAAIAAAILIGQAG